MRDVRGGSDNSSSIDVLEKIRYFEFVLTRLAVTSWLISDLVKQTGISPTIPCDPPVVRT